MKTMILILSLFMNSGVLLAGKAIDYSISGESFSGYYEKAKTKPKGNVIVIHDWDGLTDYEIKRVNMLADQGYNAFAIDLYGKNVRPVETNMKKEQTAKLYQNRLRMRQLIIGGLKQAREIFPGAFFVMGYCFGGAATLELARSQGAQGISGYATFHGGLSTPKGQSYKDSAPIFIAHGGADSSITLDDVASIGKELEGAKITYEIEIYSGAPHAFTVIGSERYDRDADEKSWRSLLAFMQKHRKT